MLFSFQTEAQKGNILIEKGLAFLASTQSTSKGFEPGQGESIDPDNLYEMSKTPGDWGGGGITALCLQAFLQNGHNINDPLYGTVVTNAINYLLAIQTLSGYNAGRIGTWSQGYETAMAIEALNLALKTKLFGGGYISGTLATDIQNAIDLAVNYYMQDVNDAWTAVSWRYDRGYTSQYNGDLSINQWVYLALDATNYSGKDVWNKIYQYLNNVKCTSGSAFRVGYQDCNGRPQGMTCAGAWGAVLAGSHGVGAASTLKTGFINYLKTFSISQLIDPGSIGSNQIYVGGGYYYYLYGFAKAMSLSNETIIGGTNWYDYMYNAIDTQHGVDGNGNYYWDKWGGQGYNMETALALLCLQTQEVPDGSVLKISFEMPPTKNDCFVFTIYDELGNAAGQIDGNWYTNIPNSEWTSTTDEFFELMIEVEEAGNYNAEMVNTCPGPLTAELCYRSFVEDDLTDEECFVIEDMPYLTPIGATGFVNAIGGLNIIIVVPPVELPVMEITPTVYGINPFEYSQTYNFTFDIDETGGGSPLVDLNIFASDLTDQFGNVIPSANFTFVPNFIEAILPNESETIQVTLVTPATFPLDPGLFQGNITVQSAQQAKGINFELGSPDLIINPDAEFVPYTTGSTTFDIDFTGLFGTDWEIIYSELWISVDPIAGNNDGIVTVTYEANGNSFERTAEILVSAPGALNPEETFTLTQEATGLICDQVVSIPENWSLISSFINPNSLLMEDIFVDLNDIVTIIIGENGIYWPAYNINTIGDWNTHNGYKIKMMESGTLCINGAPVENKTVNLPVGVSYLPVLSEVGVDVELIFSQIEDELNFAFDIVDGLIYWPAGGLYNLNILEPGKAYLLGMLEAGSVTFPATDGKGYSGQNQLSQVVGAPWQTNNTGVAHLISVQANALSQLNADDIIAVMNSEDQCVGITQYEGNTQNLSLVVYGNDFTTETIDGMVDNEMMNFVIYSPDSKQQVDVVPVWNNSMSHTNRFAENGLSAITGFKATAINDELLNNITIYPNPNAGLFNIEGVNQKVDIQILNSTGQLIKTLTTDQATEINLSNFAKGIYYLKLVSDKGIRIEKIIIE